MPSGTAFFVAEKYFEKIFKTQEHFAPSRLVYEVEGIVCRAALEDLGGSAFLCPTFKIRRKTEMQEEISAAAAEKRKRGRPAIDVSMTSCLNGTHRTHVNALYMYEGVSIISEAASKYPTMSCYGSQMTERGLPEANRASWSSSAECDCRTATALTHAWRLPGSPYVR